MKKGREGTEGQGVIHENHFGPNWVAIHPSVLEPRQRSHGGRDGGGSGEHCAAERFPVIKCSDKQV